MVKAERINVPAALPAENANIVRQYHLQKASWLWHPDKKQGDYAMLIFQNDFILDRAESFRMHVSADMRYELYLDGEFISAGPDRSDLWRWSFASYEVALTAGEHRLEAIVWWIGDKAPMAQITLRGGFILAAEGHLEDKIDTGKGNWQVAESLGWSYDRKFADVAYHVVGPAWEVDGHKLYGRAQVFKDPVKVAGPLPGSDTGVVTSGWHLYPSPLPDQKRAVTAPGRIRAVAVREELGLVYEKDETNPEVERWQGLLEGKSVTIPADTSCYVIWDLEDYYCGYEQLVCSGGADARISLEWAESLFKNEKTAWGGYRQKGNRDEVKDKIFVGFGLHVTTDGGPDRIYCAPWWHSGRYIMISVKTGSEALTLDRVGFRETRYPLENEGHFSSSDSELDGIIPMAVRGIQMCSHETLTDCPYYEQLMYVGDTRLQMLVINMMTGDDRLIRRGLELFDWSRWKTGAVAERYPSRKFQMCHTFACIWPLMLYDYSRWHDDPVWIRARMKGMRSQLMHFFDIQDGDGLLGELPGWPFVDWVPQWTNGNPPGVLEGKPSSIVNLQYIYSLRAAADLEEQFGDPDLSKLFYRKADGCSAAVRKTFWNDEKKLIADTADHDTFSEHAQCLALIVRLFEDDEQMKKDCFKALLETPDLARTTVYFSFYLFECFYLFGSGDMIQERMEEWKKQVRDGLKTPVEMPDPTRSDCHAWGSHPLWHMHASLGGVRPGSPGFRSVRIAPRPGSLKTVKTSLPHPKGLITTEMVFENGGGTAKISLPPDTDGVFAWKGKEYRLRPGAETKISF